MTVPVINLFEDNVELALVSVLRANLSDLISTVTLPLTVVREEEDLLTTLQQKKPLTLPRVTVECTLCHEEVFQSANYRAAFDLIVRVDLDAGVPALRFNPRNRQPSREAALLAGRVLDVCQMPSLKDDLNRVVLDDGSGVYVKLTILKDQNPREIEDRTWVKRVELELLGYAVGRAGTR